MATSPMATSPMVTSHMATSPLATSPMATMLERSCQMTYTKLGIDEGGKVL